MGDCFITDPDNFHFKLSHKKVLTTAVKVLQ